MEKLEESEQTAIERATVQFRPQALTNTTKRQSSLSALENMHYSQMIRFDNAKEAWLAQVVEISSLTNGQEVAASEFSHLNHSLSHRPVSVKPDISKPDISKATFAGGKLHILKPSCERNGITPTLKESLSPTSSSKVPNSPLT
ncbi:hypothetical protein Tco_1096010, partial [Tanacetum coccineum]